MSSVKSARRVFEILELFATVRRPWRAGAMSKHLRYPPSSTFALLRSMSAMGYLTFEKKTHTYFPSVRLLHLTWRLQPLLRPVPKQPAE